MDAAVLSRPENLDQDILDRQILDRQRHRLCRADFLRLAEIGVFSADDRIELIAGELIDMTPIGDEHMGMTTQLNDLLNRVKHRDALVAVQSPLVLDEYTEPEPDLLVLRFRDDYYKSGKPRAKDVLLLIEVADTSLDYDRSVKRPLYARHRIPEFWLVNLRDRVVEVYRDPDGPIYRDSRIARTGDSLDAKRLPGVAIPVAALLG